MLAKRNHQIFSIVVSKLLIPGLTCKSSANGVHVHVLHRNFLKEIPWSCRFSILGNLVICNRASFPGNASPVPLLYYQTFKSANHRWIKEELSKQVKRSLPSNEYKDTTNSKVQTINQMRPKEMTDLCHLEKGRETNYRVYTEKGYLSKKWFFLVRKLWRKWISAFLGALLTCFHLILLFPK